jgi:pimeloyl-ACP methyl ester carboxylesterase
MDDLRAVLNAVDPKTTALFGISEGGVMSALFAATYPERTAGLIINGSYPSALRRPGYPWGVTEDVLEQRLKRARDTWGKVIGMERYAPSQVDNPEVTRWWATFTQMSASPTSATSCRQSVSRR